MGRLLDLLAHHIKSETHRLVVFGVATSPGTTSIHSSSMLCIILKQTTSEVGVLMARSIIESKSCRLHCQLLPIASTVFLIHCYYHVLCHISAFYILLRQRTFFCESRHSNFDLGPFYCECYFKKLTVTFIRNVNAIFFCLY